MAVSCDIPIQVGPNSWLMRWSSDLSSPLYRIFRNGTLIAHTRRTSMVCTVPTDEAAQIEIFDDVVSRSKGLPSAHARLLWDSVDQCVAYYVERKNAQGQWQIVAKIWDAGICKYQYDLKSLEDDEVHEIRVFAEGVGGQTLPVSTTYKLIRIPDPPNVTMTYAGGIVTVSAA